MTGVEITLILVGIVFILGSFFVEEKLTPKDVEEITRLSEKELKIIVEREMQHAGAQIEDMIAEVAEHAQEDAKRSLEKETNEKIMAINEYANTVIESMNKTHNEILFLYNMLNDKHTELTEFATQLQQFAEQLKVTQVQVVNQLSSGVSKVRSKPAPKRELPKPDVVQPQPASTQVPVEKTQPQQPSQEQGQEQPETKLQPKRQPEASANFNEQVLALHQSGATDVEIARTLGRGLGEVKLVIGLYKGEDVSEI